MMHVSRRMFVSSMLSLLVILALGLGLVVTVRNAAHAASPSITLSPPSGAPSTNVVVNGTDFINGEAITINFDSTPVGSTTASSTGTFTTSFTVPSSAQTNNHTVQAVGATNDSATASFLVPANWPTIGFDAQQDHFNSVENIVSTSNVSQLVPQWSPATTKPGLTAEPTEANGLVYADVSSTPGVVYAINANTGTVNWFYQIPNVAPANTYSFGSNSVAVDTMNGVVFAAAGISTGQTPGGLLYAFNAAKGGAPLWTQSIGSASTSPVVTYETIGTTLTPVVYIGTVDKVFYKINGTNGQIIWQSSLGGVTDAPAIANGQIFVGLKSNRVQVLDSATGHLLWSRPTVGAVTDQTVVNNVLYISTLAPANSSGPDLYAVNTVSTPPNKLLWEYPDPAVANDGVSYSSIAVANGNVYVGSGNSSATSGFSVFAASGCGTTVCNPTWSAANGGSSSNLTVANGVVYAAFSDNTLRAYDAAGVTGCSSGTCSSLWTNNGSSAYGNGIAVINGVAYFGTVSGGLNAFFIYIQSGAPAISLTGIYNPVAGVASGPPTSSISINGQNFGDSESVTITMGTTKVTTQTTAGAFSTTLAIPGTTLPATYTVKAVGSSSGRTATSSFLVQTNWSNFGFDSQRSHNNPYENVLNASNVNSSSLKLKWSYHTLNFVTTSPAVANGYVYIASVDHKLYALNAITGKKSWFFDTKNPLYGSPTVANDVVYALAYNYTVYALHATTGTKIWSATVGNSLFGYPNQSSPLVVNNVVYIGSGDDNLYAFNATDGSLLWKAATGNAINSSPAVVNGVVYVGSTDGNLYAFDATTGTQLWKALTGSSIIATPAVANGDVYVGSTDGRFYAFNAPGCGNTTCSPLWTYTTGNQIFSSAAVANGRVYVGSNDAKLYAFNAAGCGNTTCPPTWTASVGNTLSAAINSSPSVANGVVYVGSNNGNVYAFNAAGCGNSTCSSIWSYTTGGAVRSSPAIANGYIYFGSYDFKVYAFGI
jgi:eukaryotic-like serine/threonine-protein kinase